MKVTLQFSTKLAALIITTVVLQSASYSKDLSRIDAEQILRKENQEKPNKVYAMVKTAITHKNDLNDGVAFVSAVRGFTGSKFFGTKEIHDKWKAEGLITTELIRCTGIAFRKSEERRPGKDHMGRDAYCVRVHPTEKMEPYLPKGRDAKIPPQGRLDLTIAEIKLHEITGIAKVREGVVKVEYSTRVVLNELGKSALKTVDERGGVVQNSDMFMLYDDGWRKM